jgi:hypothetical protein
MCCTKEKDHQLYGCQQAGDSPYWYAPSLQTQACNSMSNMVVALRKVCTHNSHQAFLLPSDTIE